MRSIRNITAPLFQQVVHKGGGGGTSTTSSGIDPEFKPYLTRGLDDAEAMRRQEAENGGAASQQAALSKKHAAEEVLNRESLRDRAYEQAYGQAEGQASFGGNLGSARQQAAALNAADNAAFQRGIQEDQARLGAADKLGEAAMSYEDAPHRSLERFFGYLGNAPQQQTNTQAGGK